jgi:phosphotransferase system enzyme I (PtsI)
MPEDMNGLGVSPGRTAGPVYSMGSPPVLPAETPQPGPDEAQRAADALAFVSSSLDELAGSLSGEAAEVLATQAMMAADPTLAGAVAAKVAEGRPAAWAITDAIGEQQEQFRSLGGYFAERAADLADLRDRAVAWLLDVSMPGLPRPGVPFVLAADDLSPADTALLDSSVLAIVTRRGGPTSHTAILARSRGLPAVVSCHGILEVPDGTPVSVDGTTGVVAPVSAAEADEVRESGRAEKERDAAFTGPGRTSDGHAVPLLLNVGGAADMTPDAEGVGLFRTEFLFLGRTAAPPVAEQETAYRELLEAAGDGKKVVVRTLDAGADKPLPFLGLAEEENPALGVRGLRTARVRPTVLAEQLEAVARAVSGTGAEAWVMAPMVATAAEAAEFASLVYKAGLPTAGVMIEVPAAALHARQILASVDFVSIGTNDLSQYTMAADRMNGELADLLDPWQPAVLQLVATVAAAGRDLNKPVGICGEAAGDPLLALVFTGMGITTLSMSAPSVPAVRAALATHTLADCRRLADLALNAADAQSARKAVAGR